MDKKIILFDVDGTIFNTRTFGENIRRAIATSSQKTVDEIKIIEEKYESKLESRTDFNSDDFLEKVSNETGIDIEILNQVLFQAKNFVLYPETIDVLEKILNDGIRLGIYSEGVLEWQRKKVMLTNLDNYFDPELVFIERRKTLDEVLVKIPSGVMIIDDNKQVIEALREKRPDIEVIWINRKSDEEMDGVRTIHNLNELF